MLDTYCVTCHNQRLRTAGLALDTLDVTAPHANPEVWERVITRLRAGSMPPPGRPRPDAATYRRGGHLARSRHRSRLGGAVPIPGRINAVHRLNRTEYNNAIRDLFALDAFDVKSLLPGDETADGSFDNFADVLTISTAHLERYLSVARQVTRLATGLPPREPGARDLRDSAARRAGRSAERGSAVRIARRHRDSLRLPGRRRVPDQGPAAPAVSGLPHGHGLAAAARRPPRRQAAEAVHRRRHGPRHPGRGQLRRRRRTGLCRRSRVGDVHAADRRRRPRGPRAGVGRARASSACRSCGSCGSRKACRNRCSAAGC